MQFTKVAMAMNSFLSQFCKAYEEYTVPDGTNYPYLTYSYSIDSEFETGVLQVRIFDKGSSVKRINGICDDIGQTLQGKSTLYEYGGASIILRKGSPFVQPYPTEDVSIRGRYINIEIQVF